MISNRNSVEQKIKELEKLKKKYIKIGLVEMELSKVKPGMIIYAKMPRWDENNNGYQFDLPFPKHYTKYVICDIQTTPTYTEVSYRKVGTRKKYAKLLVTYSKEYVFVLEKSIVNIS